MSICGPACEPATPKNLWSVTEVRPSMDYKTPILVKIVGPFMYSLRGDDIKLCLRIYKRDYVIVTWLGHFFERICQLMT